MILSGGKKIQEERRRRRGIGNEEYAIDTYGEETEEYKEENGFRRERGESNKQIEISCGFEELRRNLGDFDGVEKWGRMKT